MAFLDNSGDILLDAVLTDAGRQRMARGEFKIVKFALGDEEINYELFNSSHVSGSAFFDLAVMQTPVLEAFTNNTSSMASKLLTITRNNILHMPTLKLNRLRTTQNNDKSFISDANDSYPNGFLLTATSRLEGDVAADTLVEAKGVLFGVDPSKQPTRVITVDQGIDSNGDPSYTMPMDSELVENQYLVQVDHRLMKVVSADDNVVDKYSFVDDDNIATYYYSIDNTKIFNIDTVSPNVATGTGTAAEQVFLGPLGTRFRFKLGAQLNIQQSTALFDKLGPGSSAGALGTVKNKDNTNVTGVQYMDTLVRVVGVTTGYSLDIPVRIITK